MKLLTYEGYKVKVSPEALALKPFKVLWSRDRTKNKDKALTEFAYIYFYADPRSEYQYIVDDEDRDKAVKEGLGLSAKWKPDKELKKAIELYLSFTTTSALLLQDTRYAVDKLRTLLRDINLDEKDKNGKPIYTLNVITATIKQVPSLVRDLDNAEKLLNEQLRETESAVGSSELSIMDVE
jgi:ADP-heptose:LPS heptosyltransferase